MIVLSDKREKFCLLLVSGKKASEAYRQSRPGCEMNDQTASSRAFDLLKRPEILRRIAELRLPAVLAVRKAYKYTLDMALRECDEAYALAMALGQASVMVSAVTVKAKIAGLVIDKKEVTHGVLDDLTTKELLRIRATLKKEGEPVRNGAIDLIEDRSGTTGGDSAEAGMGRFRVAAGAPSTLNRD